MKETIEKAMKVLIGMPLWGSHRAANLQVFKFGEQIPDVTRRGEAVLIGEFGLHVQCSWRIIHAATIVVAANDRYLAAGDDPYQDYDDFDWDKQPNRLDEHITALFAAWAENPPHVESMEADAVGSLHIALARDYVLDVLPSDSLGREYWRLVPNAPKRDHFVVTRQGIEE
jgi:hypothetical protein